MPSVDHASVQRSVGSVVGSYALLLHHRDYGCALHLNLALPMRTTSPAT